MKPTFQKSIKKSLSEEHNIFISVTASQIPDQLAVLDRQMLTFLSDEVVTKSLPLRNLRDSGFRKKPDGSLEAISILDLGMEKSDRQFLTETWPHLIELVANCRQIGELLTSAGCQSLDFTANIQSIISNAVDEGLELAGLLIRTAIFVIGRDGDSDQLFGQVQRIRRLTQFLIANNDVLKNAKDTLVQNFSTVQLLGLHSFENKAGMK